ncbi:MAG: pyridoxal 5'-phosphate synthase glutaminase subunit PdxT [Anaerolineae bacterium]
MHRPAVNLVEEPQPAAGARTVGVLALQGAFLEHINVLRRLGVRARPIRAPEQLAGLDALIIPGGESTTIGKLAVRWGLVGPLNQFIAGGKPVWGTCAGLILLAKEVGPPPVPPRLGAMDISVDRNAFGRQVDSFEADLPADFLPGGGAFTAVFIRAPRITAVGAGVTPLMWLGDEVVAAAQNRQLLATTFHPELTGDPRLHQYFLSLIDRQSAPVTDL